MCRICEHGLMTGEGIARHLSTGGPPLEVDTFYGWQPVEELVEMGGKTVGKRPAYWWQTLGALYINVRVVGHDG